MLNKFCHATNALLTSLVEWVAASRLYRWFSTTHPVAYLSRSFGDPEENARPMPIWGWVCWVLLLVAFILLLLPRPESWSEAPPW